MRYRTLIVGSGPPRVGAGLGQVTEQTACRAPWRAAATGRTGKTSPLASIAAADLPGKQRAAQPTRKRSNRHLPLSPATSPWAQSRFCQMAGGRLRVLLVRLSQSRQYPSPVPSRQLCLVGGALQPWPAKVTFYRKVITSR
jgi:hypothetical protein